MKDYLQYAEPKAPHKGWHSRGYLPHFDRPELIQSLTIRLADSLPAKLRHLWENESNEKKRSQRIQQLLDNGFGACHLSNPNVANLVETALLHFDSERYHLLAWVIMPNHLHCIFEMKEGYPLSGLLHSWKSFTAHEAKQFVKFDPPFWWEDHYDRYIRDYDHYQNVVRYIHDNPVSAGLCENPDDWRRSSANHDRRILESKIIMPDGSFSSPPNVWRLLGTNWDRGRLARPTGPDLRPRIDSLVKRLKTI